MSRTCYHENKFTWKLSCCAMLLFRNPASSHGLPRVWCLSFYLLCGSVLSQPLSASGEWPGYFTHSECKPSWLWQCAFFFLCSSRKHDSSSALQRKAPLVLVVRLGSGLHLKLSFPDCFSCYKHQSHLMWLSGSVLLRGNLSRFISP